MRVTRHRARRALQFQRTWLALFEKAAERFSAGALRKILLEATMRASVVNRSDRITGDAAITVAQSLIRRRRQLSFKQRQQIMRSLIGHQTLPKLEQQPSPESKAGQIFGRHLRIIEQYKEGF